MSSNPPIREASQIRHPKRWVVVAFSLAPILPVAMGYLVDNYLWPVFTEWIRHRDAVDPQGSAYRHALVFGGLLGIMVCSGTAVASYSFLLALRLFRSREYPPRGLPLIAPTAIIRGQAATRKAFSFLLLGALSIGATTYAIWSLFRIFPELSNLLRPLYG